MDDQDFSSNDPVSVNAQGNDQRVAEDAAQAADQQREERKQAVSSGVGKEQKEAMGGGFFKEAEPGFVEKKEFEPPAEVKDWMEKLEEGEEIRLPGPVKDDYGNVLVQAAKSTKPKIVLPLGKKKMKKGLQKQVSDSLRWLSEWCLRIIKMFPERVNYRTN